MEDEFDILTDEEKAERKAQQAAHNQRRNMELADVRDVLATPQGRRLVARLFGVCGLYQTSFSGEQPMTMANFEGRRSVALWLVSEADQACPDLLHRALQESKRQEKSSVREKSAP